VRNHYVVFGFLVLVSSCTATKPMAQTQDLYDQIVSGTLADIRAALGPDVDIEKRNKAGDTAVLIAARNGRVDVLSLLVESGANINVLDLKKRDVLNIAITTNNPELARVALELGVDPAMITSVYEGGAIIYGAAKGAVEIVDMLIGVGAPLNRVNNLGWTALLEVAILGDGSSKYRRIAHALIEAGADKTVKDKQGMSAYDHAVLRGHDRLSQVLKF